MKLSSHQSLMGRKMEEEEGGIVPRAKMALSTTALVRKKIADPFSRLMVWGLDAGERASRRKKMGGSGLRRVILVLFLLVVLVVEWEDAAHLLINALLLRRVAVLALELAQRVRLAVVSGVSGRDLVC
jgi:hypothetical protein